MKLKLVNIAVIILMGIQAFSQTNHVTNGEAIVDNLLDSLWENPTSFFNNTDTNWRLLCDNLHHVDIQELNDITQTIFNGSDPEIANESSASEGLLGSLNHTSHEKKIKEFNKKFNDDFKNKKLHPNNKIIFVEGDSWFEYPLFLHEITDNLIKENNFAVYSIASGGDWVANMVSSGDYKLPYLKLKPDVFIISGGGNDIVENGGLKSFISDTPIDRDAHFLNDYREYVILRQNKKPVPMCNASFCPIEYHLFQDSLDRYTANVNNEDLEKIVAGRRYLNKNYYRWLVTLKLEYKILFESLLKLDPAHFDSLKIITQGYDYAIPNSHRKFGIRLLMENGKWLQKPLEALGITDQYTQESIIMALMFDFNEMLIELGKEYSNIYHVDVRGFTGFTEVSYHKKHGACWYDELHPINKIFKDISQTYIAIINNKLPKNERVFSVIDFYRKNNAHNWHTFEMHAN